MGEKNQAALTRRTVLIAEDKSVLARFFNAAIHTYGYTVLLAPTAAAAIELCNNYGGTIDGAIIDVEIATENGRRLAEQLQQARPELKVLFVSSDGKQALVTKGVLPAAAE